MDHKGKTKNFSVKKFFVCFLRFGGPMCLIFPGISCKWWFSQGVNKEPSIFAKRALKKWTALYAPIGLRKEALLLIIFLYIIVVAHIHIAEIIVIVVVRYSAGFLIFQQIIYI
jgi:hypothetical protein